MFGLRVCVCFPAVFVPDTQSMTEQRVKQESRTQFRLDQFNLKKAGRVKQCLDLNFKVLAQGTHDENLKKTLNNCR